MKLYIVRHGQVDHNLHKKYNREDEDLNATGIKEAEEIKEMISNIKYDVVICSHY
jgi:Fructose-2,6-bisphosphatase